MGAARQARERKRALMSIVRDKGTSRSDVEAAVDTLEAEGLISTEQEYTILLTALGRKRCCQRALGLLQSMPQRGVCPNVIHFNAAISACEVGGRWDSALMLLDWMRLLGVQPDVISFNAAISACAKGGQWAYAVALLQQMATLGLEANVISYSAAIDACARGGQWETALMLLGQMREAGVTPNAISFNSAITACERGGGHWRVALELLGQMREAGVTPDVVSFGAAISACGRTGQWFAALELLAAMRNEGIVPDVVCCSAVITACERGGAWAAALQVLGEMLTSGPAPDVVAYSAAISACAGHKGESRHRSGLDILDWMFLVDDVAPNTVSFNAAIAACERGGAWQQALQLLGTMRHAGALPDGVSFNMAIAACTHASRGTAGDSPLWRRALGILAQMPEAGIKPTVASYTAAIGACEAAGCWQRALAIFAQLRASGLQPDGVALRAALRACEAGGAWGRALELLAEVRQLSPADASTSRSGGTALGPAATAIAAAASATAACRRAGRWEEAVAVVRGCAEGTAGTTAVAEAIRACSEAGKLPLAKQLLDELRQLTSQPRTPAGSESTEPAAGAIGRETAAPLSERLGTISSRAFGMALAAVGCAMVAAAPEDPAEMGSEVDAGAELLCEAQAFGVDLRDLRSQPVAEADEMWAGPRSSSSLPSDIWRVARQRLMEVAADPFRTPAVGVAAALLGAQLAGHAAGRAGLDGTWAAALQALDAATPQLARSGPPAAREAQAQALEACVRAGTPWVVALQRLEALPQTGTGTNQASRASAALAVAGAWARDAGGGQEQRLLDALQCPPASATSSKLPAAPPPASSVAPTSWEASLQLLAAVRRQVAEPPAAALPRGREQAMAASTAALHRRSLLSCAQACQWESALRLLDEMWEQSIDDPNHECCRAVASACEGAHEYELALTLLEAIEVEEAMMPKPTAPGGGRMRQQTI